MAGKGQKVPFADQEVQELACTYAALILYDGGVDVKATQIDKLVKFAGLRVEAFWSKVYEKALKGKDIGSLIQGGDAPAQSAQTTAPTQGKVAEAPKPAAPAKVEKAPEPVEEDMDIGGMFDF